METNKFKRAWIWFWYNDVTRWGTVLGIPSIFMVVVVYGLFGWGEYLLCIAVISYIIFLAWAIIDNNYSNLRRIGMDEYRNKIKIR